MFGNFRGAHDLDLTRIRGLDKTVMLTASSNKAQVKGHSRTIVYAQHANRHAAFQVLALNEPLRTPLGRTDTDLLLRHKGTGQSVRIEVKETSLRSQRANLSKYKLQIEKMAAAGERGVWMNRRPVLDKLAQYAQSKGVLVYENVCTGGKSSGLRIEHALDDLSQRLGSQTRLGTVQGHVAKWAKWGGRLGVGALVASEGYVVYQYARGNLTNREMVMVQSSLGGGLAGGAGGALAGAKGGAALGSFAGPWGTFIGGLLGGIAGGVGGGLAGAKAGELGASRYFEYKDEARRDEFNRALLEYLKSKYQE